MAAAPSVEPLTLDVTDAESVRAAAAHVRDILGPDGRLRGIVNCAGLGLNMPMEYVNVSLLRQVIDVNVIGLAAVTAAFMPLLERPGGRVVNVSSLSGLMSTSLAGPYCASKYAVEAMSDALRVEIRGQGLFVSLIEPAVVATEIHEKNRARSETALAQMPEEGREKYGAAFRTLLEQSQRYDRNAVAPSGVARVIHHALTAGRPRARYPVGAPAKWLSVALPFLPTRVRDALSGSLTGL